MSRLSVVGGRFLLVHSSCVFFSAPFSQPKRKEDDLRLTALTSFDLSLIGSIDCYSGFEQTIVALCPIVRPSQGIEDEFIFIVHKENENDIFIEGQKRLSSCVDFRSDLKRTGYICNCLPSSHQSLVISLVRNQKPLFFIHVS